MKKENEGYIFKYNNENTEKIKACNRRDEMEGELKDLRKDYYVTIQNVLSNVHCRNYQYIERIGKNDLYSMIKKEYELGKQLGISEKEVSKYLDCYLIQIYSYFTDFAKAYDVTIIMAEEDDYWVYLDDATLGWAKKNNVLFKLYNVLERALVNFQVKYERRKEFEGYLEKIREIRGY